LPLYIVWAIKFARGARLQKAIKRAALIEAESGVQRWRPQGSLPTAETPERPVQSRQQQLAILQAATSKTHSFGLIRSFLCLSTIN